MESFNGGFQNEPLPENIFRTLDETRHIIETWRCDYNRARRTAPSVTRPAMKTLNNNGSCNRRHGSQTYGWLEKGGGQILFKIICCATASECPNNGDGENVFQPMPITGCAESLGKSSLFMASYPLKRFPERNGGSD